MATELTSPAVPRNAPNKWLVLGTVGLGGFTFTLVSSGVNIALPLIQADFRVSMATVEWVTLGFLLTTASSTLLFGRLGDIAGHKRMYSTGFVLFCVGSLLCGLAPSIGLLIPARILQALANAMMLSVGAALVTGSFPLAERGRALGLQASAIYIGMAAGPVIGGVISSLLGWRWIFLVNVPLAALGILGAFLFLPEDKPERGQRFDLAGAGLFVSGLAALLYGTSKGSEWGWGSPQFLGFLFWSLLCFTLFVRAEGRAASPILPLTLFRNRVFASGVSAQVLNYVVGFIQLFLTPFYLIGLRGFDSRTAGLIMAVQPVVMFITSPIAGRLSDRLGSRGLAATGLALQGLAMAWVANFDASTPAWQIALPLGIMGLGIGAFTSPNNSAIMGAAPRDRQGLAASLVSSARHVGMVLGVALGAAIFLTLREHLTAAGVLPQGAFLGALSGSFYTGAALAATGVLLSLTRGRSSQGPS